jgi:hypothetical protein
LLDLWLHSKGFVKAMAREQGIKELLKSKSPLLLLVVVLAGVLGVYVSMKAFANIGESRQSSRKVPAIAVSSFAESVRYGEVVTLSAVLPSDCAGTVGFYDGATTAAGLLGRSGKASMKIASLNPGQHKIHANYRGSRICKPSISAALVQQIEKPSGVSKATATSLVSSRVQAVAKTPVSLIARVSGVCGPTGVVNFYKESISPATLIGTAQIRNGRSILNYVFQAGTHNIFAIYDGDSTCEKSASPVLVQTVAE